MKQEVIPHLQEYAPAGAFAAGIVVDRVAAVTGDRKRAGVISTQGLSQEEYDAVTSGRGHSEPQPLTIPARKGAFKRLVEQGPHLAIPASMAVAAGLAVNAWSHESTIPVQSNAVLGAVASHEYNTSTNGAFDRVNNIFQELDKHGNIKVRAVLAHNSHAEDASVKEILADARPFGSPAVKDATESAISGITAAVASVKGENVGAGILVTTNDEEIGSVRSIVSRAKKLGNMPVFVANVGDNNDATAKHLQGIAKQTGGKYWTKETKASDIVNYVEHKLRPQVEAAPAPADNKLFEKILSGMAAALAAGLIAARAETRFKGKRRA